MALLFLMMGIVFVVSGIFVFFLLLKMKFKVLTMWVVTLVILFVAEISFFIPYLVPSNEVITEKSIITTSITINGTEINSETPMRWTWKERKTNTFSYASFKKVWFDYRVEGAK